MLPAVMLSMSGVRIHATYLTQGSEQDARDVAEHICVEQTIEFPLDLVADDDIRRHLIGQITGMTRQSENSWYLNISYAAEVSGFQLPQLLNMLFGNISLRPGVRLTDLALPDELLTHFPGPRYGVAGLRDLLGCGERPLLATALKPMGVPLEYFAEMAADYAESGIDLIKDDHGLSSQPFADFRRRVELCSAAVTEANARSGNRALYLPSLNVPADQLFEAARFASAAGAGGLMVMPGLHGFDAMRVLAQDNSLSLPIMAHPSFLGSFVASPGSGIDHGLLFGTFMRLAGADVSVFPSYGGRFTFSQDECRRISRQLMSPLGTLAPAFAAPAGGLTLDRIAEVVNFFGHNFALLVGGELQRRDRRAQARAMRAAVESAFAQPADRSWLGSSSPTPLQNP